MAKAGIPQALRGAAERGVGSTCTSIRNSTGRPEGRLDRARDALAGIGVGMKEVHRLHSKLVVADEGLLAVGSFNWLSADRAGGYARHETSLVYRGSRLSREIEVLVESLDRRATAR